MSILFFGNHYLEQLSYKSTLHQHKWKTSKEYEHQIHPESSSEMILYINIDICTQ